jgi:hypothetical protein
LKKILPTLLAATMLGSKSIITQTLRLMIFDIDEFCHQIRQKLDPDLPYINQLVEHYERVDDIR